MQVQKERERLNPPLKTKEQQEAEWKEIFEQREKDKNERRDAKEAKRKQKE